MLVVVCVCVAIVIGYVAMSFFGSSNKIPPKKVVPESINAEVAMEAGKAAVIGAKALKRNNYKIQLARVAVKRAILRAAGMKEI